MSSPNPIYVVRQNALVITLVLGWHFSAGLLFPILPWFVDVFGPLWVRVIFTGVGVLHLTTAAVLGWRSCRTGLVIDRCGIWCGLGYSSSRPVLVPWADVLAARFVTWTSPEGEHEGVLLELSPGAEPPGGKDLHSLAMWEIEGPLGPRDVHNPTLLSHDEWDWQPQELADVITRCIEDPPERNEMGVYSNTHIRRPTR